MSWASDILRALESGPRTTAQLRETTGIRGANISSVCNYLIRNGRVQRVDTQKPGRGYPATYVATGKPPPERSVTKLRAENADLRAKLAALSGDGP
jgi:DNA-binding HxlR family transcriptional regulator